MRRWAPEYRQYERLIKHKARHWASRSTFDADELEGAGNEIFLRAARHYRHDRLRAHHEHEKLFSSFLWQCLDNGLLSYIRKHRKWRHEQLDEDTQRIPCGTHVLVKRRIYIRQCIDRLSHPARYMVEIILTEPAPILGLDGTESAQAVRGQLVKHARKHGHSWSTVWNAMREVKSMLKKV